MVNKMVVPDCVLTIDSTSFDVQTNRWLREGKMVRISVNKTKVMDQLCRLINERTTLKQSNVKAALTAPRSSASFASARAPPGNDSRSS